MRGLEILLFNRLGWYEAHIGASDSHANSLSVVKAILVGLNPRFNKLRADLVHIKAVLYQLTSPVIGAATDIHHNKAGRQVSKKYDKLLPRQSLS